MEARGNLPACTIERGFVVGAMPESSPALVTNVERLPAAVYRITTAAGWFERTASQDVIVYQLPAGDAAEDLLSQS